MIVLAAWLAGPTASAVAARRALAPCLREPRFAYGGLAVIVFLEESTRRMSEWLSSRGGRRPA